MGSKSKQPAARLGDIDTGHPGAGPTPVITASANVRFNGKPAARKGDQLKKHHKGKRVIVEGVKHCRINGKPAVRVTDAINCGGVMAKGSPNVRIGDKPVLQERVEVVFPHRRTHTPSMREPSPSALPASTFSPIPSVVYSSPAPLPPVDDSKEVTLHSTFARDQLVLFAQKDSVAIFMAVLMKIFRSYPEQTPIPASAFEALYHDAQAGAGILTATHQAKEWFDGEGGFHTPSQEIWVYDSTVRNAALPNGNERRGRLMTLLVEEYGHYLDWLLRHHYSSVGGDSMGDEGARFSYRLYHINPIEQSSQHFADATVDGAAVSLVWDFSDTHTRLTRFVSEQRQQQEDRSGDLEFFKAGKLNVEKGEYGHKDIEVKALMDVFRPEFYESAELEKAINIIYFGNWLRDFSQAVDPMIVRPMAYGAAAASNSTVAAISEDTSVEIETFPDIPASIGSVKKAGTFLNPFDYAFKPVYKTVEFRPVMLSVEAITSAIEVAAAKEFIHQKDTVKDDIIDYRGHLKKLRSEFLPVNTETLGVYRPEEHIDNPKGVGHDENGADRGDKALYSEFVGYIPDNDPQHDIDRTFGMKRYIRTKGASFPTAYDYIMRKLDDAAAGGGFDDPQALADFGAAMHTLEDYFAHTNYAEIALINVGYPLVFPWVDSVPTEQGGTGFVYQYDQLFEAEFGEYKHGKVSPYDDRFIILNDHSKITPNSHPLATYIPLVTGTFGSVDTAASVLPVINEHIFSIEIESWTKAKPGERSFSDVLILELLKDFDLAQQDEYGNTGTNNSSFTEGFEYLLTLRDAMGEIKDRLIPDFIEEGMHWISERIAALFNFIPFVILKAMSATLNDAQVLLDKDLKRMALGDFTVGPDPSHTQVAKDDTHHPLHQLAAELAIAAVKDVGVEMARVFQGGSVERAKAVVRDIMRHPCETTRQNITVKRWARTNSHKICEASSPSALLNSALHLNEEIGTVLTDMETHLPRVREEIIGQINSHFDTSLEVKNDTLALTNAISKARQLHAEHTVKIQQMKAKWDGKFATTEICKAYAHHHHHHHGPGHQHQYPYTIQWGDTLSSIAKRANTSVSELKRINGLSDDMIYTGDRLMVPKMLYNFSPYLKH